MFRKGKPDSLIFLDLPNLVINSGIKANSNKILAITEIGQVRNVRDVQWLMGYLATLSRFVSWLGEHRLPCTSC
jgi:hypothetical protein